jgi:hypothetical protein
MATAPEGRWETSTGCPTMAGWWLFNELTGEALPARCRRVTCTYCAHWLALRRAAAIAYSRPERAILLTRIGSDWQTTRRRYRRVREYVGRAGIDPGSWCLHVEDDPNGDGDRHGHVWQHGGPIPQRLLSSAAERAGCGPIARITASARRSASPSTG